ncbi:PcfJ-like protein [Sesbania bispinosa]|nr:PcfJ-like protein [Sesbania bispinosa]
MAYPMVLGRLCSLSVMYPSFFCEADLTEALEVREREIRRLRNKNEKLQRLMKKMQAT